MHAALVEMGSTVARYFTPEEKSTFSSFAQALRAPMPAGTAKELAIPLVQAAGLADREAAWRYELMMNSFRDQASWMGQMTEFVAAPTAAAEVCRAWRATGRLCNTREAGASLCNPSVRLGGLPRSGRQ